MIIKEKAQKIAEKEAVRDGCYPVSKDAWRTFCLFGGILQENRASCAFVCIVNDFETV